MTYTIHRHLPVATFIMFLLCTAPDYASVSVVRFPS